MSISICHFIFFFFNDTATTEIYTLSLHDALPIWSGHHAAGRGGRPRYPRQHQYRVHREYHDWPRIQRDRRRVERHDGGATRQRDRKSTRLNSSHSQISYAVFCLKKKKQNQNSVQSGSTPHAPRRGHATACASDCTTAFALESASLSTFTFYDVIRPSEPAAPCVA